MTFKVFINESDTNWLIFEEKWWRQTESNRRHKDFQSFALPTELWSHYLKTRCV